MTFPSIIFGTVLACLLGALFHLWKGGKLFRLVLYILLSVAGFWTGHVVGNYLGWRFAEVGALNAGMAALGSAVFLFVGHWLSLVEVRRK